MKNINGPGKRKFLTQYEVSMTLDATNSGPCAARNYCLTLLCFIHGLRVTELCSLRLSDINTHDKCIHIHRLKKGFSTTHPLMDDEIGAIQYWLDIRKNWRNTASEWLFLSRKGTPLSRQQFYQIISSAGKKANLSVGIHPHMLRHSCGFALADMGVDTRLIQDYLGHRNIRHTVWYTASNTGRFYSVRDKMTVWYSGGMPK